MKYIGKNGLRVADKKVWHEGNFNPSSKSDTGHAHTIDSVLASGSSSSRSVSIGRYMQSATGVPTSNLGAPSVTEMALFDSQFDNKTWFYPPSMFTFEYTNDGANWVTQSISESQIKNFVSGYVNASIYIPNGCKQYRIRIDNKNSYVYVNALYMYFSTSGNNTKVKISKKRDDGDWVQHTNSDQRVSSWPGHLYLPFSTIPWSRASTSGHYRYIEILFTPNWNHATNNITLYRLELWGGYPAGSRSLFSWDGDKNATFPAEVKASAFKNSSGIEVSYSGHNHDGNYEPKNINIQSHISNNNNPHGVTKSQLNLGNVDNTSDINKPISTATQTALDNKVDNSRVLTDVPANAKFTDTNTTYSEISTAEIDAGTASTLRTITGRRIKYILDKVGAMISTAISGLTKSNVGLNNVDNVQQASKSEFNTHNSDGVRHITGTERTNWNSAKTHADTAHAPSNAQKNSDITKAEIEAKLTGTIGTHNHTVTKANVGLGNVDNTSDTNKPISTATQNALNLKANLASPALTGTPTAPTATSGTNTTQIATTAFVQGALSSGGYGDMLKIVYDTNNDGKVNSADSADTLNGLTSSITELNFVKGVTSAIQAQLNSKAPTNHATTATTYGVASTTNYGHVKLNTAINSISATDASTPSAVKQAYDLASSKTKIVVNNTQPTGLSIGDVWIQTF